MKPVQYYIVCALGAICLVLGMTVLVLGRSTYALAGRVQERQSKVQTEMQQRQEEINKGMLSQQIANNIVNDVAAASLHNPKLAELLKKFGLSVSVNSNPPGSNAAPQASPATQP